MLVLLAAIGIVGLLVTRRYGVAHVLRTVNQALGIARVLRTARLSVARPTHRRRARKVRPKVMGFLVSAFFHIAWQSASLAANAGSEAQVIANTITNFFISSSC
jgi:hypothetical protein